MPTWRKAYVTTCQIMPSHNVNRHQAGVVGDEVGKFRRDEPQQHQPEKDAGIDEDESFDCALKWRKGERHTTATASETTATAAASPAGAVVLTASATTANRPKRQSRSAEESVKDKV